MKKSLFFIDDDDTYVYLLERAAQKMDTVSDVYLAKDGKDALTKLETWRKAGGPLPDVMFVDINMPVMDGFEFLEKFGVEREEFEELKKIVPVVMLTSSQHEADRERALATGFVEQYVVKPAGTKNIMKVLKEIIE